jgi:pimeloyl-ACP methyl ester carboxylesterase
VNGRVLWRIEAGAGRPDVVLEAGRNDVASSWRRVMLLLAPRVHVVAYDRAGLGASEPSGDPFSLNRQVGDLASVITSTAAGPCILAGHSWGGILVQLLAWRRPDLVAGLVLVDPAQEQMNDALPGWARRAIRLARAGRRDELRGGDAAASATILRELRELRGAPQPFPDVPVTVLSATRGFPRRFRAHWTGLQAELAATAPQGRHLVIDGTGHSIHQDRPDAVADAIQQIIAEIQARSEPTADAAEARRTGPARPARPGRSRRHGADREGRGCLAHGGGDR